MNAPDLELLHGAAEGSIHSFSVQLPEDLVHFRGHFPGQPVLPAIAQLEALVLPAVERAYPDLGTLEVVRRLKFLRPLAPGDPLEMRLEREQQKVTFAIRRRGELVSTGDLAFR